MIADREMRHTLKVICNESNTNCRSAVSDEKPEEQGICDGPPLFPKGSHVEGHHH